jgi:hypothetical protein
MFSMEHTTAGPVSRPIMIEGWPLARTPLEGTGSCDVCIIPDEACQQAVRRFLHAAMRLCNAGSAGLSMLADDSPGTMCWKVVTGALADEEGRKIRRDRSPCGVCFDTHAASSYAIRNGYSRS